MFLDSGESSSDTIMRSVRGDLWAFPMILKKKKDNPIAVHHQGSSLIDK